MIWGERGAQETQERELIDLCQELGEQLGNLKLVHNFTCIADDDASYKYRNRQNRILDLSNVDHIDLDERIDFNSSIRPLIDEKKLEYL